MILSKFSSLQLVSFFESDFNNPLYNDFEILSSFLCELTILLLFKNQNLL